MRVMQSVGVFLTISGLVLINSSSAGASTECGPGWVSSSLANHCEMVEVSTTVEYPFSRLSRPFNYLIKAKLRAGMLIENPQVSFKGNILYFEGLGDSMLNHRPLFNRLVAAGYRVIAFDYLGQGGSEGSMNDTKIWDIPKFGMQIYQRFARQENGPTKPIIIGWSTGGLAAYYAACLEIPSQVILIAPGIVPKVMVGEQHPLDFKLNQITLASLTTDRYGADNPNPHVDPIRPHSPLEVKDFAADLIITAHYSHHWSVPASVAGFVLLSGEDDTYVDPVATEKIIHANAPQFETVRYAGTLHEIDNETPGMRAIVQMDILKFLGQ